MSATNEKIPTREKCVCVCIALVRSHRGITWMIFKWEVALFVCVCVWESSSARCYAPTVISDDGGGPEENSVSRQERIDCVQCTRCSVYYTRGKPRQLNLLHPHKLLCHFAISDDYLIGDGASASAQTINNEQMNRGMQKPNQDLNTYYIYIFYLCINLLRSKLNDDDVFQPIYSDLCVCVCARVFPFRAPLTDATSHVDFRARMATVNGSPSNDLMEFYVSCFVWRATTMARATDEKFVPIEFRSTLSSVSPWIDACNKTESKKKNGII